MDLGLEGTRINIQEASASAMWPTPPTRKTPEPGPPAKEPGPPAKTTLLMLLPLPLLMMPRTMPLLMPLELLMRAPALALL